jgi:hypothetical protein
VAAAQRTASRPAKTTRAARNERAAMSGGRRKGKRMPPTEPPVVARPVARAREAEKKWATEATAGVKIREVPRPQRRERERTKWWYSGTV